MINTYTMGDILQVGHIKKCYDTNYPYYAEIIAINEENHPWVGVKVLTDGTTKSVERRHLRFIQTTTEHLKKLGFEFTKYNRFKYYQLGNVLISGLSENYAPNKLFYSGLRQVPKFDFWIDAQVFFKNGEIDLEGFDIAYPDLNELNVLIDLLRNRGLFDGKTDSILEKI